MHHNGCKPNDILTALGGEDVIVLKKAALVTADKMRAAAILQGIRAQFAQSVSSVELVARDE